MAITQEQREKGLEVGMNLWGKHKGEIYVAHVVEDAEAKSGQVIKVDGMDTKFNSVSAAGGAVFGEGRTCNGWSFWTIGEPGTTADGSTKTNKTAPPKKAAKAAATTTEAPADEVGTEEVDEFECGVCHEVFSTEAEAQEHLTTAHA